MIPLGQREAFQAISRGLLPGEILFDFWDNIFIVAAPERLAILHRLVETALWDHTRISINQGKMQMWNRVRCVPSWLRAHCRGREESQSLPTSEQRIRILGTPFGHSDHVEAEVRNTNEEHSTLLSRILAVRDLQCV